MSGSMQQAAPGAIPPQMLMALLQRARMAQPPGQQGRMPMQGSPMGAPGQPPQMPGGAGPMAAPGQMAMPPGGQGPMPQAQPPIPGAGWPPRPIAEPNPGGMGQAPTTPSRMAGQGRMGDSVMAHMTPGEVAVPPQVQTPELMRALQQAFGQAGVSPQQFTAGSPFSSTNPQTGAPEYSLWSALLPVLGAIGGSFIPGIGTAAGAALGGAAGGAAGGLIDKQTPTGVLLSAAGGGLGGYMGAPGAAMGTGVAPVADAALTEGLLGAAANQGGNLTAKMSAQPLGAGMASPFSAGAGAGAPIGTAGAAGADSIGGGLFERLKGMPWKDSLKTGMGAGMGAAMGGALAPPPAASSSSSGMNRKMGPLNTNYGQLLGSGQSATPSFDSYSPYSSGGAFPGYRFFPVGG